LFGFSAAAIGAFSTTVASSTRLTAAPVHACASRDSPIQLVATAADVFDRELPLTPALDPVRNTAGIPTGGDAGAWHPVNTADVGIRSLNAGDRDGAQRMLDVIRSQADQRLRLAYNFPYEIYGQTLQPPWYSGMAQGYALALAVRLGDRKLADGLFATLRPDSPLVSTSGGDYWIEEYPETHDPVLNGHVYAAMGLWEYWRWTGSNEARDITVRAIETVRRYGDSFFDADGIRVWYDLGHRNTIHGVYWRIYVEQFDALAAMTGEDCFSVLAAETLARMP
jgi:hypothetical protein